MANIEFPQNARVMGMLLPTICMPHAVVVAFCSLMTFLLALYFYTNSKRAVHGIIQPSFLGSMISAGKIEICGFDPWQLATRETVGKICGILILENVVKG